MSRLVRIPNVLRLFSPRLIARPGLLPYARLTNPTTPSITPSLPLRTRGRFFQTFSARLSSNPSSFSAPSPDAEPTTVSARLKHLIKSYGWYALAMYFMIGVLDFGVSFAAINFLGAEQVSRVTNTVKESVYKRIGWEVSSEGEGDAEVRHGSHDGLYAMLILAWTVHKTLFLPVRVGVTAAVTPRFVGWLRAKGWAGSAGAKRAVEQMKAKARSRVD